MKHQTEQDALSIQLLDWLSTSASLAGTGGGHLAGVEAVLGVAHEF